MPAPITPLVGCDIFVPDPLGGERVLLIRRADNGFWALPGGFHDLGETPVQCAERECLEETGLRVRVSRLLGVFSSECYPEENYPYKGGHYCHILFLAQAVEGQPRTTRESTEFRFFAESELPPLTDGHAPRIAVGFAAMRDPSIAAHFE